MSLFSGSFGHSCSLPLSLRFHSLCGAMHRFRFSHSFVFILLKCNNIDVNISMRSTHTKKKISTTSTERNKPQLNACLLNRDLDTMRLLRMLWNSKKKMFMSFYMVVEWSNRMAKMCSKKMKWTHGKKRKEEANHAEHIWNWVTTRVRVVLSLSLAPFHITYGIAIELRNVY